MSEKPCILFDWGGTLMRELPEYGGLMVDWPVVEAMPGIHLALDALQPDWQMAVATNADMSGEEQIRGALRRVGLDGYFNRIYCYLGIGHKKPAGAYFRAILEDLQLPAGQVVMVGDSYANDIAGAVACGLRAVWYNPLSTEHRRGQGMTTVHDLRDLPAAIGELVREPGGGSSA